MIFCSNVENVHGSVHSFVSDHMGSMVKVLGDVPLSRVHFFGLLV